MQGGIVIVCALITFAGVFVTSWFNRRAMRSKADEKSVDERLAAQSIEIAKCERERGELKKDAEYQSHRIDELNTLALKLSGSMVSELSELVRDLHKGKLNALILPLLAVGLLTGCDTPRVSYGGTRAGVQTLAPFEHFSAGEDTASGYLISFLNVGEWVTLNAQPIFPFGAPPLLKVGADVPLDPLLKKLIHPLK